MTFGLHSSDGRHWRPYGMRPLCRGCLERAMKFCNRILVVSDVPGMLLDLILKLPIERWAVSQSRIWFRDRQDMWVHMPSSSIRFGRLLSVTVGLSIGFVLWPRCYIFQLLFSHLLDFLSLSMYFSMCCCCQWGLEISWDHWSEGFAGVFAFPCHILGYLPCVSPWF